MTNRTRSTCRKAMTLALRKGFDPYNSADAYAAAYRCVWRLNQYR